MGCSASLEKGAFTSTRQSPEKGQVTAFHSQHQSRKERGMLTQKRESSLGGDTSNVSGSGRQPFIASGGSEQLSPSIYLILVYQILNLSSFRTPGTNLRSVHI